jgi:hypothetical protein
LACAACASTPQRPLEERYARLDWAKVPVLQAEAECRAEINRPGGIPNMYLCMKSKGFEER